MASGSHGEAFPMLDPMTYIGRVKRDENGRVESMEVFYDDSIIQIEDGDEFVTFTTVVLLEEPREMP